jgi:Flp pilus assembly protein TadD
VQPQIRSRMPVARPRPRPQGERVKLEASAAKAPVCSPVGEAAIENRPSQEGVGGIRSRAEAAPPAASPYEHGDLLAVAELARHYLFSGDLPLALVLFEGLTTIAPEEPYFALGLALTYDQMSRTKEAVAEYQRAEKLDPSDARPAINRAELQLEIGDRALARELLTRAVQKAKRTRDGDLERKASVLLARIEKKTGDRPCV